MKLKTIVAELQVLKDNQESKEIIEALSKELPKAQVWVLFRMGICYTQGIVVKKHPDFGAYLLACAAEQWRRKAKLGDAQASTLLAECYEHGYGVEVNQAEQSRLEAEARQQQKETAEYTLTHYFSAKTETNSLTRKDVFTFHIEEELRTLTSAQIKDLEDTVKDLKNAQPLTLCKLALCYAKSYGVKSNGDKIVEYLEAAMSKGFVEAFYLFAVIFPLLINPEYNDTEKNKIAVKKLILAARKGCTEAQNRLARASEYGEFGLSVNLKHAFDYHHKAAKAGHMYSAEQIAIFHINGTVTEIDSFLGLDWLGKASLLGNPIAEQSLADLGLSIQRDNQGLPIYDFAAGYAVTAPNIMDTRAIPSSGIHNPATLATAAVNTATAAMVVPAIKTAEVSDKKQIAEGSKINFEAIHTQLSKEYPERKPELLNWSILEKELTSLSKASFIALEKRLARHEPIVLFKVGLCYLRGILTVQDPELAQYFLSAATEQWKRGVDIGDRVALLNMAQCYFYALGVDASTEKALQLIQRISSQQTSKYMLTHFFSVYHTRKASAKLTLRFYIEEELKAMTDSEFRAMEKSVKDLDKVHPLILCKLALCYWKGIKTKQNGKNANNYLIKAQDLGFIEAYYLYARLIAEVAIDSSIGMSEAFQNSAVISNYKEAARLGCVEAQYMYGMANVFGYNKLPIDYKIASEYYLKAAAAGHRYAAEQVGVLYINGFGVARNKSLGEYWFRRALELGNLEAQQALAKIGSTIKKIDHSSIKTLKTLTSDVKSKSESSKLKSEDSKLSMEKMAADLFADYAESRAEILFWPMIDQELAAYKREDFEDLQRVLEAYQPMALFKAGICYDRGICVESNPEMGQQFLLAAIEQWRRRAKFKDRIALYNMAQCCHYGLGMALDKAAAIQYLERVQQKISPRYYLSGHFSMFEIEKEGDNKKLSLSFHIAEELRKLSVADIQKMEAMPHRSDISNALLLCKLVFCYWYGIVVKKDADKAHNVLKAVSEDFAEKYFLYAIFLNQATEVIGITQVEKNRLIKNNLERGVELGCVEAQFTLGAKYVEGESFPKDLNKACELYKLAASAGYAKAAQQLWAFHSNKLVKNLDPKTCALWLERAALQGNLEAQRCMLAVYYYGAHPFPKDYQKTSLWLNHLRSIPLEKMNAQETLISIGIVLFYRNSIVEAIPYFKKIADHYPKAMYCLGRCYVDLERTLQEMFEGYKLIRKAAAVGFNVAKDHLDGMYNKGAKLAHDSVFKSGYHLSLSNKTHFEFSSHLGLATVLKKLTTAEFQTLNNIQDNVERADPVQICKLAYCYFAGIKVKRDFPRAITLTYAAIQKGLIAAYYLMGMIAENIEEKSEKAKAYCFYLEAAELGCVEAQFEMIRVSREILKNPVEVASWTLKAAKNNYPIAMTQYGYALYKTEKTKEAFELWEKAAKLGELSAQIELGKAYSIGNKGVPIEYARAVTWFEMAANQGHIQSKQDAGICFYKLKNLAKAKFYLEQALDAGYEDQEVVLGLVYRDSNERDKAFRHFYNAAQKNIIWAMYYLWQCYFNGNAPGGKSEGNDYKAYRWLKCAVDKKLPQALAAFAKHYTTSKQATITGNIVISDDPNENKFDLKKETEREFFEVSLEFERREKVRLAKEAETKKRNEYFTSEISRAEASREPYKMSFKLWRVDKKDKIYNDLLRQYPHFKSLRFAQLTPKGIAILKTNLESIQKEGRIPSAVFSSLMKEMVEHQRFLSLQDEYRGKIKKNLELVSIALAEGPKKTDQIQNLASMLTSIQERLKDKQLTEAVRATAAAALIQQSLHYEDNTRALDYYYDALEKCYKHLSKKDPNGICAKCSTKS